MKIIKFIYIVDINKNQLIISSKLSKVSISIRLFFQMKI